MLPKRIKDLAGFEPRYKWADYSKDARLAVRASLENAVANGYDQMGDTACVAMDICDTDAEFEGILPGEIFEFVRDWQIDKMMCDAASWTMDLYAARVEAKKQKRFERADQIRFALESVGVDVLEWDRSRR